MSDITRPWFSEGIVCTVRSNGKYSAHVGILPTRVFTYVHQE